MYFGHGYGLDIEIPFNDSSFLKLERERDANVSDSLSFRV